MSEERLATAPEARPAPRGRAEPLSYSSPPGRYDEMLAADGAARPQWREFLGAVEGLGLPEFVRRWEDARHLIREHGISYNVYGDPRGRERSWQLDPFPLLIAAEEARALERSLSQRARLLDLILADLYGQQLLLREGLLPHELVFANPGFLRPCHGISPAGGRYLTVYAANLVRAPDGSLRSIGDRTQAPSGAGYALENRIVIGRMLPQLFRQLRVERLAHFFQTLRESLRALSPQRSESPRVVLLTPGPYNETYFEHAFLARYLGWPLVEGGDLTVRDDRVYLKLLEGLQPVDVIFRRLDDDYCDPLELEPDSFLGVPGLMHVAREGNVAIANALGSGLLEAPALLAYLPLLARRLLDEDLLLPSVPTWWCGDPASLAQVLGRLDRLVIKPAFAATRLEPIFGNRLSEPERRALGERIRARPGAFAAQEIVPPSTVPVLAGDRLEPRSAVLRAYLCARGDGYALLPGGLTRYGAAPDTPVVSMQSGGGSKDTWMLSSGPVSSFSLLPARTMPIALTRAGGDLPSRAADNLFWLGRYTERADGLTRLLRGIVARLIERPGPAEAPELIALVRALPLVKETPAGGTHGENGAEGAVNGAVDGAVDVTGDVTGDCRAAGPAEGDPRRATVTTEELAALIFDPERSGSLTAAAASVKRVAAQVRDQISLDMWRAVEGLDRAVAPQAEGRVCGMRADPGRLLSEGLDLLDRAVLALAAFGGLCDASMTRGAHWRFVDIGRRLERALHTIMLLDAALGSPLGQESPVLEAVLEIADSSMTYRRRYLGDLQASAVLDLLLTDDTNPRSLIYQLVVLADDVRRLPERDKRPEESILIECLAALQVSDLEDLDGVDGRGGRPLLRSLLRKLGASLTSLSDLITESYLSHLQTSRHLGRTAGRSGA